MPDRLDEVAGTHGANVGTRGRTCGWLMVLAACRATEPTVGSGETGASPSNTTGAATEHVRVLDGYTDPVDGVPVAVNDADGALVAEASTGADGAAEVDVPSGGSITVFLASATVGPRAFVVRDIPDGGDVVLHRRTADRPFGVQEVQAETDYTFDLRGLPVGTAKVRIFGPCGAVALAASPPTALIGFSDADCAAYGTFAEWNALVLAEDANGTVLGWGTDEAVAASPGGARSVGPLYLTSSAVDRFTFTPGGFSTGSAGLLVSALGDEIWPFLSDVGGSASAMQVAFPSDPAGFGLEGYGVAASVNTDATEGLDAWSRYRTIPPPASPGDLDVALTLDLGDLADIVIPAQPDLTDPSRPSAEFALSGPRGDAVSLTFSWHDDLGQPWGITVVQDPNPSTSFSAVVPEMPAALAVDFAPTAGDDVTILVELTDLETTDGYASFLSDRGINWLSERTVGETVTRHSESLYLAP